MSDYRGNAVMEQLVHRKGGETYIFRYVPGQEDQLLDAIIEAVKSKRTSFDWFDAAVLSLKLTPSLIAKADQLLKGYNTNPTDHSFNPADFYRRL